MTERANQLHLTADRQISELLAFISTLDEAGSRRPCPGRERLGDGTVAACARHTADNYQRIADFLTTSDGMSTRHGASPHGGHRIPRFLRSGGHGPESHRQNGSDAASHDAPYTADKTHLVLVARQLSTTRESIGRIADLTDGQLDAIPPEGAFRFCDGHRTIEQVLASLLKHQAHQLDSLRAVV
jgi:hypothetical protein